MSTKTTGRQRGDITKRQLQAVRAILLSVGPPGLPEIARQLELAGESSVRDLLRTPQEKGLVEWHHAGRGPANMKTLRVTPRGLNVLAENSLLPADFAAPDSQKFARNSDGWNLKSFPLPCGPLKEAIAEPEYILGPADLFDDYREGDYVSVADGDSMELEGCSDAIWRGDKVLLRPDICPANGESVHAEYVSLDGVHECTLKVFELDEHNQLVTLKALNSKYSPIVLPAKDVYVYGVVMSVLHRSRRNGRK